MATTAELDRMNVPSGGLASFLTSNMDEIEDNILAFGQGNGINSMQEIANRMAQMGRNGDNYIIHASEREMLVPREVVEKNPELRNQIMQSIAAEGADPEAYVVGSDANSINPMTGQREFFLKKLVSGVKKIAKKVVNVVKKAAPVILPIALNMAFPGLGTIASGALGAGIGTLVQGGSMKDAFRNAAFGGAIGGLYSGISGVMSGQGFMSGVQQGLPAAFRPTATIPTVSTSGMEPAAAPAEVAAPAAAPEAQPNFFERAADRVGDFFGGGNRLTGEARLAEINRLAGLYPNAPSSAIEAAVGGGGTTLQRFGPMIGGGLALGALTGAFNPIPADPIDIPGYDQTSTQLLESNPTAYQVGVPGAPQYAGLGDIRVRTAAQGGEMESFPRRMGAISGPGTETSDDVPAMLSDGEFVMTARAVRGAGNGSREKGVRRMYDMMRMFEGGVAR
jgi:hypothetical protein